MGGYVIVDLHNIDLSSVEPIILKGLYKKLQNASNICKPIMFTNVKYTSEHNKQYAKSFFAQVTYDIRTTEFEIVLSTTENKSITVNSDDNITVA